jgi:PAP2 superfamily
MTQIHPPLTRRSVRAFLVAWTVGLLSLTAGADVILDWNSHLREVMKQDTVTANPGWSSRAMAIVNGAMYDCFQAVKRTHQPLYADLKAAPNTSRDAAALEAAFRLINHLYPQSAGYLKQAYDTGLNSLPANAARKRGQDLGAEIAQHYLTWRQGDGSDVKGDYVPSTQPGKWRPDPLFPTTQKAWGAAWKDVTPFVMLYAKQFQPDAPPALNSPAYTAAWREVVDYGAKVSPSRTADQTEIGLFWAYDRAGMGPPPILYNSMLAQIARSRGNTTVQNARLFAMASVAMADSVIAAWDAKFTHNLWRPTLGIREAATDGNPATPGLPTWVPLGAPGSATFPDFMPPFPAYVSGHATMGEAAFAILREFYGRDAMTFSLTSDEVPGRVRTYTSLSQAAQENADSRVYLGVHWRFDQTAGQKLGQEIAHFIAANAFGVPEESFGTYASERGLSGNPSADTDSDGVSDFAEYAFDTDPAQPTPPTAGREERLNGVPCLVLRYTVVAARTSAKLIVTPQASTNLIDWSAVGLTDELDPAATQTAERQYRRAWFPLRSGLRQRFLRLEARQ